MSSSLPTFSGRATVAASAPNREGCAPYSEIHPCTWGEQSDMSTDDPSSSSTNRRLCLTRSESVLIFIPDSTLREHAGTNTRDPSTSTTQTRQTLTGVRWSSWQSVGVSISSRRHASRMVEPSTTSTPRPSMLTPTIRRGIPTKTLSAIQHLQLREARGDRVRRRLPQSADRRVAHRLRDVAQQHDVGPRIAVALAQHPFEDLLLALRAHPARHALPARFVPEKPSDAQEDLLHVRAFIEHHHRA